MKIAITGHRPNKLGNDYDLTSPLIQWIKDEINKILSQYYYYPHELTLITGMALGIDTLFAKIAIENNVPFIAAVPCPYQESKWLHKSQVIYTYLLSKAKEIVTVSDKYDYQCMQKRNIYMVDNCDILIAVWDGTSGGTANCINYAKSKNKQIVYINPNDYKSN